jgi:uncharacterized protein YjbI with pentapeptide repeats
VLWREWLGVGERRWKKAPDEEVQPAKTLWDWLQLLIVPAILVAVTFAWSATQTRSDNKREDRRIAADRAAAGEARQDATLRGYLDQMSGLMLHEKLLTSKKGDGVSAVARTVTLATVRRLDGERRGDVVRFLSEARLLKGKNPRVLLNGADLGDAHLEGAHLEGANLESTNLEGANLADAHLGGSSFDLANLKGADLERADLTGARLFATHLEGANLEDAYLRQADLSLADLSHAILDHAGLEGANLTEADLTNADVKRADLRKADLSNAYLEGANLKDADLSYANLYGANNLDLGRYLTNEPPEWQKRFLDSQKYWLDSLYPDELAEFNLSPEKLAKFRREARGA